VNKDNKVVSLAAHKSNVAGIDTVNGLTSSPSQIEKTADYEIEFLDYNVEWIYEYEFTIEGIILTTRMP
jgi:hypothetical protein